ncbi:hypothetical protein Airi02_075740 [Actinoallomurus iriomotensis]|uniref:Uncharacterized protein n=1 Tax=Actinoallomurus iriomotensis TaxID=478107 RepID=A0A9W6W357_9ACTN|nr:hypothetical protein Airi02_075740 [Actinoallomurus iriomotensis]
MPRGGQSNDTEATEAKLALDSATVPARPRLYSDDATVEVLTSLLCEQGGRMAVLPPEGEIFSIAAGRYSGTFAVLKKGHAGEEVRVDRMGRDSEHIDAATVTLGICTRPGVLAELGDTPQFRDQGLLGRLLYAVPDSLLGHHKSRPRRTGGDLPDGHEGPRAVSGPPARTGNPDPDGDLVHMTDWGGKLVGSR